ncbi:MAG: hypothetical protein ACOC32_00805 [Nanoarchaeota archaeon]
MMTGKKAFMKTVEAFLAIMITFMFLLVFLPRDIRYTDDQSYYRLDTLERDDAFRNCVLLENPTCIDSTIDTLFEGKYLYTYDIYRYADEAREFNRTDVRTYTWFYAGNLTSYRPIVFKLYYWDPGR